MAPLHHNQHTLTKPAILAQICMQMCKCDQGCANHYYTPNHPSTFCTNVCKHVTNTLLATPYKAEWTNMRNRTLAQCTTAHWHIGTMHIAGHQPTGHWSALWRENSELSISIIGGANTFICCFSQTDQMVKV